MMNWFRRFMYGRYGSDPLNTALLLLALVLMLVGELVSFRILVLCAVALLVLCYFRMFSRNISARYAENQKFMGWWDQRHLPKVQASVYDQKLTR